MSCLNKPVLHNISSNNVLFVYRQNDSDSEEVANYYSSQRCVPEYNLLAIPCSSSNIITEQELTDTILEPIIDFIQNPYDPYLEQNKIFF